MRPFAVLDSPDPETRARVNGTESQMKRFDFYLGGSPLCNVLSHTKSVYSYCLWCEILAAVPRVCLCEITTVKRHFLMKPL